MNKIQLCVIKTSYWLRERYIWTRTIPDGKNSYSPPSQDHEISLSNHDISHGLMVNHGTLQTGALFRGDASWANSGFGCHCAVVYLKKYNCPRSTCISCYSEPCEISKDIQTEIHLSNLAQDIQNMPPTHHEIVSWSHGEIITSL